MIVVDVETSGINPEKHSLVSIGAVDFEEPKRRFHELCRIWDGAHILTEGNGEDIKPVIEINGLTEAQMRDPTKQSVGELIEHFKAWVEGSSDFLFAGHNPSFDLEFINFSIKHFHIDWSLPRRSVDLHSVCYAHMRSRGLQPPLFKRKSFLSSDAVMEYVGIPLEPKPHLAINGAMWEAEAFSRLINEKPLFPEFEAQPIPWKRV